MGAFGRLWVRAPIWRRLLYFTCVMSALTIWYPPPWLGGVGRAMRQPDAIVAAANQQRMVPAAAPTVAPIAPGPSGDAPNSMESAQLVGGPYSGRFPLGAQSIPLPPGKWVALASQSGLAAAGVQERSILLAFILDGRLIAAAIIVGSTAADPRQGGYPAPLEVQVPSFYYRRVFSAIDHDKVDLWVAGFTRPANWTDPFRQNALAAFRKQSLPIPDQFNSAVFRLADKRNWLSAEFMFPDSGTDVSPPRAWIDAAALPDSVALPHTEKVRRWGKAWHEVMRRAFEGAPPSPDEARVA